jgi:feruloyl esterase
MFPPQPALPPRSRPVFAYPQVAAYTGHGSVDDAASFIAKTPAAR